MPSSEAGRAAPPAWLVAHRGHASRYPENTLLGLEAALAAGVARVELDVQLSADAVPVVLHDASLRRTAGLDRDIRTLPAAQAARVEVAERERFGDRFAGERLPLLADVVTLLGRWPRAIPFVEVKRESAESFGVDAAVERVVEVLAPVVGRCVVISFVERAVQRARRLGVPEVGWCLNHYDADSHRLARALGPDYLLCDHRKLPPRRALWKGRWRWGAWEITDAATARALRDRGVDLIETMACAELGAALAAAEPEASGS